MDIGKHHTKLEKCVFVINSNDVVLWIHLFWLGPVLFHFMKLIEFLMRLSKRTNKFIKNWQMGLHSAVLGILPLCVCMCVCVSVWERKTVRTFNTLCACVCGGRGSMYGSVMMCFGPWPCLKTWRAEMSSVTVTLERLSQQKKKPYFTCDLCTCFLSTNTHLMLTPSQFSKL